MSSTGTQHILQTKLTRYTIKQRLGAGGMATVYHAWDNNLERDVAIKVLHEHLAFDSAFQERFEREAKFVAGFNHPHIVHIFDSAMIATDDIPIYYMVMPYLTGQTLEQIIADNRQRNEIIPDEVTLSLIREISSALDYAHARGMIHRDVKPANILYDNHNRAILTDFGIARLVEKSNLTGEGLTVGTPAYMPPEQAQGLEIDHRADIYSLGVIAYELITGMPPFGEGSISVLLQHINAPVPKISDHIAMPNESLDTVINRVMAKNPDNRYSSASDFADDLEKALQNKPISNPAIATKVLETIAVPNEPDPPTYVKPTAQVSGKSHTSSPLGLLAIGLGLVAFVLVIALLIQPPAQATIQSINNNSDIADSMTDDTFYFETSFDNDDSVISNWDQTDSQFITREISDGIYTISNNRDNTATTSLFDPAYIYDNVKITLSAHLVDTQSTASGYGIVFRYVDAGNYNVFAVDGRGRFSIWVREDAKWHELRNADSDWTENPSINPEIASNTLTIDIYENTLTGFVNGEEVVQLEDDTLQSGAVGIYLATTPQGSATIEVDSFTVSESNPPTSAMTDDSDNFSESMTDDED